MRSADDNHVADDPTPVPHFVALLGTVLARSPDGPERPTTPGPRGAS